MNARIFLWLGAGCAAAPLPEHLSDSTSHPTYPPSSYLTAVGQSGRSMAEAEARARAAVAEQIRSEIRSVAASFEQELRVGSAVGSSGAVSLRVEVRSEFSRAELLRVDPKLSARHDGQYLAFAYGSRRELSAALGEAYETAAVPFRRAVAEAERAPELLAFVAAYRTALRTHPGPLGLELAAVAGGSPAAVKLDLERLRALLELRSARLAAVQVAVQVAARADGRAGEGDASPPEASGHLEGLLARALVRLGVVASPGACAAGLALTVEASPRCGQGSFGHRCQLGLLADLRPCGGATPWARADLSDPSFAGASPRGQDDARAKMWNKVSEESLAARLGVGLGAALPLEPSP